MKTKIFLTHIALLSLFSSLGTAEPMSTAFTYQGQLTDRGAPANGNFDFQFTLYDDVTGGAQW